MNKKIYLIVVHALLITAILFGVSQCKEATKSKEELVNTKDIIKKANDIVSITIDSDSNKITKSIPQEATLSTAAISTKQLIDSVSKTLNLASNEKVKHYGRIPIESSVQLKASKVNQDYAEAENENWYISYSFRDSIFQSRYKTIYQTVLTEKENKFIGITYKNPTIYQRDWITDKGAQPLKPMTVSIKEPIKKKTTFQISNVNKFRNFDNSVLSGGELELGINRTTISGQYLYNFNTNKPEYEVALKLNLFK